MNVYKKEDDDYFELPIFVIERDDGIKEEWVVGDYDKVYEIASEKITDTLWTFNVAFIVDFLQEEGIVPNDNATFNALKKSLELIQKDIYEDANSVIEALIGSHLDEFISKAIDTDGLGHFLSNYDSELHETRDIEGLNSGWGLYCFRIN